MKPIRLTRFSIAIAVWACAGLAQANNFSPAANLKADYQVAKEKCNAMSGDQKDICISSAKAWYQERW